MTFNGIFKNNGQVFFRSKTVFHLCYVELQTYHFLEFKWKIGYLKLITEIEIFESLFDFVNFWIFIEKFLETFL